MNKEEPNQELKQLKIQVTLMDSERPSLFPQSGAKSLRTGASMYWFRVFHRLCLLFLDVMDKWKI